MANARYFPFLKSLEKTLKSLLTGYRGKVIFFDKLAALVWPSWRGLLIGNLGVAYLVTIYMTFLELIVGIIWIMAIYYHPKELIKKPNTGLFIRPQSTM